MRILITGAKGQLGTEILNSLKRGETELGQLSKALKNAEIKAIDVDELDICDIKAVRNMLKEFKPDAVINCAAMTNVDACEQQQELAMKVNALGPRNLALVCGEIGCKLTQVSTDYVFAGDGATPYAEWDKCDPQSIYGKSKRLGEMYVKEFTNKYFIFRTAWLYGYYGNNFVKTIIKLATERDSIMVVDDQRGNPTNCADLAHHILSVIETEEYGVYHCTGEGECSWFDFAEKIVEYKGLACKVNPCTTEEFPRPAKRPAYSSLDNLMLKTIGKNKMRDWQSALKMYIERENI